MAVANFHGFALVSILDSMLVVITYFCPKLEVKLTFSCRHWKSTWYHGHEGFSTSEVQYSGARAGKRFCQPYTKD